MTAEQYHCPLRLRHMPSVYSSDPPSPNGTSGQRPAPSRLLNCTLTPSGASVRLVIVVVIGQFCRPTGELSTIAFVSVSFWFGMGVPGPGLGAGPDPEAGV